MRNHNPTGNWMRKAAQPKIIDSRLESRLVTPIPNPDISQCATHEEEIKAVASWIQERNKEGLSPKEFGIFVRSQNEIPKAIAALDLSKVPYEQLQETVNRLRNNATLSTMHQEKGLDFRAVVVMAYDENIVPNGERIRATIDDRDLEEVANTERNLLYVACTRARDHILISYGDTCSEFIEDLTFS